MTQATLKQPTKYSSLWTVLYYNPEKRKERDLKKGLIEYDFLLSIVKQVAIHIKNHELERFDALVGENSCQIRAIKVALAVSTITSTRLNQLIDQIQDLIVHVRKILSQRSIEVLMRQGVSLLHVIIEHGVDIALTSDELFILRSFLLCEAKSSVPDDAFMPALLRKEKYSAKALRNKYPHLSYSFIAKLTDNLRVQLARDSVKFVRKVAAKIGDNDLKRMVSSDYEIVHNKLACIPAFWSFKALFYYAQTTGLPLAFHAKFLSYGKEPYQVIDEDLLLFKTCGSVKHYQIADCSSFDSNNPVCVVEGALNARINKTAWRKSMRTMTPLDVLMAAAADHRQYPKEGHPLPANKEYNYFKHLAGKYGFALSNPTTFFIRHIYPSTISHVINKVDITNSDRLTIERYV
ncbi:hypothetical protein [Candidatus Neptunichlamydia sp. REUL1]|uniref:hypothetical protein n=1 Tax=Candidatus Neptunichlamydia sp. REUL1 TaxID=3064277 RepID=UPI00292E7BFF|nr:hypothetical protein [Candidatus Neptunochlamydia sp. REUL1]